MNRLQMKITKKVKKGVGVPLIRSPLRGPCSRGPRPLLFSCLLDWTYTQVTELRMISGEGKMVLLFST